MSDDLKDLIRRLLDKNPNTRLGSKGDADEIVYHPWFHDVDWDKLMKKELTAPYIPDPSFAQKKDKKSAGNDLDVKEQMEDLQINSR